MRQFNPILIKKNGKGVKYPEMDADKAIKICERYKGESIIETTAFGITEQLTIKELKDLTTN